MALPTSGALSLNAMHVEAGGTSGTSVSINDSDVRGLISKGSGAQMSFNEWYGASAGINLGNMKAFGGFNNPPPDFVRTGASLRTFSYQPNGNIFKAGCVNNMTLLGSTLGTGSTAYGSDFKVGAEFVMDDSQVGRHRILKILIWEYVGTTGGGSVIYNRTDPGNWANAKITMTGNTSGNEYVVTATRTTQNSTAGGVTGVIYHAASSATDLYAGHDWGWGVDFGNSSAQAARHNQASSGTQPNLGETISLKLQFS